jgi:hypothetical protein
MGFEDEAEQSFPRPCRQTDGGFKQPKALVGLDGLSRTGLYLFCSLESA